MNALYPERFSDEDEERLERALDRSEGAVRAALRAALSEKRRARAQREQLARLRGQTETEVRTLPFIFEPELGPEDAHQQAEQVG
jgi:hypothetical protein